MRKTILILLLAFWPALAHAQSITTTASALKGGPTLPATCKPATSGSRADVFVKTGSSAGVYYCSAVNTFTILAGGSGGTGTVTSVSVTTANGVSGAVATATTTPAITLTLGAITPTTVNGNTFTTGTYTLTGAAGKTLTFSNTLTFTGTDSSSVAFGAGGTVLYNGGALGTPSSGTATNLTGTAAGLTAGAATVLATARAINGVNFDGSAAITVTAAAGTLSGATLASGVTASSLTSFGSSPTIVTPSFTTGFTIGGVAATGTIPRGNGTNFVASAFTMAAPGTSGNVLTSDGTNWVSSASSGGITLATTTITGGANTKVLFNNSGVVGEYTISGSGNVAMTTSPSFTTPTLGVASATSINKVTITAPATGSTLTIADGKTASFSNSITFAGTDSTVMTFPGATDTVAGLGAAQTFTGANAFNSAVTTGTTASSGTVFSYNSLTSGTGMYIASTSTAGTGSTSALLDISRSGAQSGTVTTTSARFANTATGASATNVALTLTASGATAGNAALNVTAGQITSATNGALSAPAITATGTWITGGTATTTKPYVLIEPSGATSTAWSTSGTGLGVNAASAFTGQLLDLQLNGVSKFKVDAFGTIVASSAGITIGVGAAYGNGVVQLFNNGTLGWVSGSIPGTNDVTLRRAAAANLVQGGANSATPAANTHTIGESSRPGTDSNVGGANGTITSGAGTGTGTLAKLIFQSPIAVASGSGAQTQTTGLTVIGGTAQLTPYTVSTLPTCGATLKGGMAYVTDATQAITAGIGATVAGGGANIVPVFCDGTNWVIN